MSDRKSIFSKAFDAMIQARSREAARYVEQYQRSHTAFESQRVTNR